MIFDLNMYEQALLSPPRLNFIQTQVKIGRIGQKSQFHTLDKNQILSLTHTDFDRSCDFEKSMMVLSFTYKCEKKLFKSVLKRNGIISKTI